MQIPGVHITTTLHHPTKYTPQQIDRAAAIAAALNRGQFVLCAAPER